MVSYQNLTMKRILLEKQAYWLFCQGQGKIEEGCWHVFDFMHAFLHCLSSQNYIAKSGAIKVTPLRFLVKLNQISVDII